MVIASIGGIMGPVDGTAGPGTPAAPAKQVWSKHLQVADRRGQVQIAIAAVDLPPEILAARRAVAIEIDATAPLSSVAAMAR
jgi:hypothetical protein